MPVRFHQIIKTRIDNKKELKLFLEKMLSKSGQNHFELDIIFCDDQYLLDINRRFLKHDYYTDIITFDLSDSNDFLKAELYISGEMVSENAKNQLVSFKNEIHRVIFHGVLHLLGYTDKTASKKVEMRKMEDIWLSLYFG
jgi:rRNA maturation RNase YbeY